MLEYALEPEEFADEIKSRNWKIEYDIEEDMRDFSNKVDWETKMYIESDSFLCEVYVEGTATAEISYERWVDTYNYWMNEYNIDKIVSK